MKALVFRDVHGRDSWAYHLSGDYPIEDYDKIVFVGDYFDSFNIKAEEQMKNYLEIVALKEMYPDKVVLLLGNHDTHYLIDGERYSGFQNGVSYSIANLLESKLKLHQMAVQLGQYLITHAGVTKTWAEEWDVETAEDITQLFQEQRKPFRFFGANMYGDDVTQSPVWVRPESLLKDGLEGVTHVVGHTVHKEITHREENGVKAIFIDSDTDEPLTIEYDNQEVRQVVDKETSS